MAKSFSPRLLKEFTLKTFWIFWLGTHIFLFFFGFFKQKDDRSLDNLNVIGFSLWTSRGAGLCLAYDGALILLPVLRNIIKDLRDISFLNNFIPFDENLWFHRQTAYAMLFWTLVHTFAHYVNFWKLEQLGKSQAWQLHYTTWAGLTGHFMLLIMVLMYTSSHHKMRHQSFETFWYTHHLAFFFMFCLYFHDHGCFVKTAQGECKGYFSRRYTIVGGVLYFFERVLREIRARHPTQITKVIDHPSKAIEIQFNKPSFRYKAGQYLFLNVPAISTWQWHPFTITSAPDDPYISVHVRLVGDFTNKLGELLGCNSNFDTKLTVPTVLPTLRIDGPYGALSEDVFKNKIAVLIGCGIGATPFISILKNICHQQQNKRLLKLKRVEFFWICRETGSFEWFRSLLKTLEATPMEAGFLKFHIYLTSKLRESIINNIIVNDISDSYDPLTDLESIMHYGRPNFGYIFRQLNRAIESGYYLPGKERDLNTNVGVYYCGPPALAKSLKKDCDFASTRRIIFHFHKEHF
ncbi:26714_t:CDS:2 [Dentiscutata erythropus]|uniref:26714_t:CDS:1 n=1 Tax=Dentiscutata erythropus TaxID=1348616 RepID=A0A9N9EPZ2_9GLOM|nr:26714_t:CDS:2 [Dentiscutata erythropus]